MALDPPALIQRNPALRERVALSAPQVAGL